MILWGNFKYKWVLLQNRLCAWLSIVLNPRRFCRWLVGSSWSFERHDCQW